MSASLNDLESSRVRVVVLSGADLLLSLRIRHHAPHRFIVQADRISPTN